MSTIASMNVSLTADTQQFMQSMQKASEETEHFEVHMLTSRRALQTFAGIAGESASPLSHLVHSFEVMPGPIGIAIGATFAFVEAMRAHNEAAEKAAEQQAHIQEVIRHTGEALHAEQWGKFSGEIQHSIDALEAEIEKLDRSQAKSLINQQNDLMKLRQVYKELDDQLEEISDRKFDVKMGSGGEDMSKVLNDEANALLATMNKIPEGSKHWLELKHQLGDVYLEMKKIRDENEKINQAAQETAIKEKEAFDKKIADQFAASVAAAHREVQSIHEQFRTVAEKLEDQLEHLQDLRSQGLGDEDFNRASQSAIDSFMGKNNVGGHASSSTFRQIDPSQISLAGLAMSHNNGKQEIQSEQLKVTNETLAKILEKVGIDRGAVVARG